jgi:ABC-type transport system involved in multi-copper enzyme maturation permease subunit
MNSVVLIALNTFKETIRNKVLYNILLFAAVLIVLSISFGEWSVFARVQVMEDFGLATMSVSGLLLAVFIGVGMLGAEIGSKTIYTLMAKPIGRVSVLLGKFFGLLLTLFVNFGLMTVFFLLTLKLIGGEVGGGVLLAVVLSWVEMTVIVAVALLFSTFTTPTLAAMFTLGFYLIGHYNDFVDVAAISQQQPLLAGFLKVVYYLLPNLEHFNIRSRVIYDLGVSPEYVGLTLLYGALYAGLFLVISTVIFSRKDV